MSEQVTALSANARLRQNAPSRRETLERILAEEQQRAEEQVRASDAVQRAKTYPVQFYRNRLRRRRVERDFDATRKRHLERADAEYRADVLKRRQDLLSPFDATEQQVVADFIAVKDGFWRVAEVTGRDLGQPNDEREAAMISLLLQAVPNWSKEYAREKLIELAFQRSTAGLTMLLPVIESYAQRKNHYMVEVPNSRGGSQWVPDQDLLADIELAKDAAISFELRKHRYAQQLGEEMQSAFQAVANITDTDPEPAVFRQLVGGPEGAFAVFDIDVETVDFDARGFAWRWCWGHRCGTRTPHNRR